MPRSLFARLSTAALAGAVVLALGACSSSSSSSAAASSAGASRGLVGVALPTSTSDRWIADGSNMKHQFELLGYTTDLEYADNDVAKQITQLQAMIDHHAKALVVGSIDGTKLKDVLAKAASAKIPVIAYDRLIRGSSDVDYYATFDNYKVGVLQATSIVEALKLKSTSGTHTIELFAGSSDDNNAYFFFNGALSVLKPYLKSGRLTVPSGQLTFAKAATAQWDGARAKVRMNALLAAYPSGVRIDAVLSPYDGISRGILEAFTAHGYGKGGRALPYVTGQDAELDSIKLIAAGTQGSTVYKDTRELAKVAVQMVDSLAGGTTPEINDTKQYDNGVEVVPTFLLQPVGVDKSNYQRVLVGGGYYTQAQIDG